MSKERTSVAYVGETVVEIAEVPTALPIISTLNSILWIVNILLAGCTSAKQTGAVCQSCVCTISGLNKVKISSECHIQRSSDKKRARLRSRQRGLSDMQVMFAISFLIFPSIVSKTAQ